MRHALGQTKIENQNIVLRHHPFFSPQYWTSVPDSYKRFNSLEKFKMKIKTWIPENCHCRLYKTYIHKQDLFICL